MQDVETAQFTVGVFQDVDWAARGVEALRTRGFSADSLTILGQDTPEVAFLLEKALGASGRRIEVSGIGAVVARGPLVETLGSELAEGGLAENLRRVGFQQHDGRIFERLTARGGVLVAVHSAPGAADALAVLLSYGGGNAAIGAWSGRV